MKNPTLRRVGAIILSILLLLGAAACSDNDEDTSSRTEDNLDRLPNNIKDGTLHKEVPVDDGRLELVLDYSTNYDTTEWKITKSKTFNFEASIQRGTRGEGAVVYVTHVHVDVSLLSSKAGLDGIKQDSMDDSLHSGTEPGFSISDGYPYQGVFAIEGFSDTLISGWGFVSGGTGVSELEEKRLTEKTLVDNGVTGSKFSFVYDLMIKYPGDTGFHKSSVSHEFIVPVKGKQQ